MWVVSRRSLEGRREARLREAGSTSMSLDSSDREIPIRIFEIGLSWVSDRLLK